MAPPRKPGKKFSRSAKPFARFLVFFWVLVLGACAADPASVKKKTDTPPLSPGEEQRNLADSATGAWLSFHYSDYYSLLQPDQHSNPSCAGDAKNYYQPFTLQSSSARESFPKDYFDETRTVQPSFIKDVSVDITDTNAASPHNNAYNCSYGATPGAPGVSSCATFDYGALAGVSSVMGGSVVLVGGVQGTNYADLVPGNGANKGSAVSCGTVQNPDFTGNNNSCGRSVFALAIETVPASAATDPPNSMAPGLTSSASPISTWANFGGSYDFVGPEGVAGASAAYSPTSRKMIVVGGASLFPGSLLLGRTTADTWSLDLATQTWSLFQNVSIASTLLTTKDIVSDTSTLYLPKSPLGKALFGYASAVGFASTGLKTDNAFSLDPTERLLIVGGVGSGGATTTTHRFNPTFGPEYVDLVGKPIPAGEDGEMAQWLDSYHTQILSNASTASSQLKPPYSGGAQKTPINFGLVPARNNAAVGTGYVATLGGFDAASPTNTVTASGGQLMISQRFDNFETISGEITAVTNSLQKSLGAGVTTNNRYPLEWPAIPEGGTAVPWYGGVSAVPGFNLQQNDIVYFGGADCRDYLTSSSAICNSFANPGAYYSLGTGPATLANLAGRTIPFNYDASMDPDGAGPLLPAPPKRAGMATARGLDPAGRVIIVAWGGVSGRASPASSSDLYYLYDNSADSANPAPVWVNASVSGSGTVVGTLPRAVANGAIVFSHVTKKFYLFGGYNPSTPYLSGDTWELSVSSSGNAACKGATSPCSFTWRQLSALPTFSCTPNCPSPRQGHRMIEANYVNRNPGGTVPTQDPPTAGLSGENLCSVAKPCSYGIFMEGGMNVSAQPTFYPERWMFDPTANGGGQWIQLTELPPRTLAAMTSVEYTANSSLKVKRAVLFGGELGLQNPNGGIGRGGAGRSLTEYFHAPTLGDTLLYDFDTNTWNRATLLGKGYNVPVAGQTSAYTAAAATFSNNAEFEIRQAFDANHVQEIPHINELTPPPLSGAIMVTRTMPKATLGSTESVQPLKIPEVFLIGGKKTSGAFNSFDHVWKFCIGTTGEIPKYVATADFDQGQCDSYHEEANTSSPSPTNGFYGRWIRKAPSSLTSPVAGIPAPDPDHVASFMGAGAYDSVRDRIVVVGGKTFKEDFNIVAAEPMITDQANFQTTALLNGNFWVYEYTPPSRTWPRAPDPAAPASNSLTMNGSWTRLKQCTQGDDPAPRYGHSLSYDPLGRRLIMVGGYDFSGNPLTQLVQYYAGEYTTPEVWSGERTIDSGNGTECYNWKRISHFGNVPNVPSIAPPLTGVAHMASIFIPSTGYNTGYYSTFDNACYRQGPIASTDPSISKLLAGGAYFDIDRTKLGPNENLLLHLTLFPLGSNNIGPDSNPLSSSEAAVFKVHLIKTGKSGDELRTYLQPRYLLFSDTERFPEVAKSISVFAPSVGDPLQEQIILPISMDSEIDRIRIERYSGSAILIDAGLYRMGYR